MKIVSLVGPTASGKTDIAIEIAKRINGEIISADSRQVYEYFNIGTAKSNIEERQGILHYLIDVASPTITYTVSDFKKDADTAIKEIQSKGKVPIVAGGTGFYVQALLEGLDIPAAPPDEEFRKEMREFAATEGNDVLYQKLMDIDEIAAKKLHANDVFRVIRALEIHKHTGQKPSDIQTQTKPDYDALYFGLNAQNRDYLYDRINLRTQVMLDMGLVDEVQSLIKKYGKTLSLLGTLGYKEICEYLDGKVTLDEAKAKIQKNTRNYAKRQLTWFRKNERTKWYYIDIMVKEQIVEEIIKNISESGSNV